MIFYFCNPWTTLQKKSFNFLKKWKVLHKRVFSCQNEIASKTCFLFWYIKICSKTCIKILATWKALQKRVFSLSKRNRFEHVFIHFVREKTFKNIFFSFCFFKINILRKCALPLCKTCSLLFICHMKIASKTYFAICKYDNATKSVSYFFRWKTLQKRAVSFYKYEKHPKKLFFQFVKMKCI